MLVKSVYGEATVYCPGCHALETLEMENCRIAPTSRWRLEDGRILHRECGVACSVFTEYQARWKQVVRGTRF